MTSKESMEPVGSVGLGGRACRPLTHYVVAARGIERVSTPQELHTPDLAYAGIPGSRLRGSQIPEVQIYHVPDPR